MPGEQLSYRLDLIVHRNADDLQSVGAVGFLPAGESRQLLATGCAPGRPEIQQQQLAAITRQRDLSAGHIGASEIRRLLTHLERLRRATQQQR